MKKIKNKILGLICGLALLCGITFTSSAFVFNWPLGIPDCTLFGVTCGGKSMVGIKCGGDKDERHAIADFVMGEFCN